MAFEKGGYADKLGNRYESRWVVKQYVLLLQERIQSVTVEAIGDDEKGVDLIVHFKNNIRQFQQCKARNQSSDKWTISDLSSRNILNNMKFHLDREPRNEVKLISGVPSKNLEDICESARKSNNNPEDFYKYQICEAGQPRLRTFSEYCSQIGLDKDEKEHRARAFDYLKRTYIEIWDDNQSSYEDILSLINLLIDGKSETIIASLSEFAEENIRKVVYADDLRKYLSDSGFHLRKLVHDTRLFPAVERLKLQFSESISNDLICDTLIPRDETEKLLKELEQNNIIILHGDAGTGKSGVLYELSQKLTEKNIQYIPVRLDRQEPKNTTKQFGTDIGLPESPSLCLEAIAFDRPAVLILDQLDALRWTSSHSENALAVCKNIIREVTRSRLRKNNISVIISCRTFDLEHDPEIKKWLNNTNKKVKFSKIEVKHLPEEKIKEIVTNENCNYALLNKKQISIISSPHMLNIWTKIVRNGKTPSFNSSAHLMQEFWEDRIRTLEKRNIKKSEVERVINDIISFMEVNGKLNTPNAAIDCDERVLTELQTVGVIRIADSITFCHQTYFDYKVADRVRKDILMKQGSIVEWLGPKNNQSLFKREQVRQVLLLLWDDMPELCVRNIKFLIESESIRFHIKHLVLEIVSQIDNPDDSLISYIFELEKLELWKPLIINIILFGNPQYISIAIEKGYVDEKLNSVIDNDVHIATRLLRSVADRIPDDITHYIEPYIEKGEKWHKRVLDCLCWNVENDSDIMFELRLKLMKQKIFNDYIDLLAVCKTNPIRVIKIFEAVLSTWESSSYSANQLLTSHNNHSKYDYWDNRIIPKLDKHISTHSIVFWELIMPQVERLTKCGTNEYNRKLKDWFDDEIMQLGDTNTSICTGLYHLLVSTGKILANTNTKCFIGISEIYRESKSPVIQKILLESYASLPPKNADYGVEWLISDTRRFALGSGYQEPKWMSAVRLIKSLSNYCSDESYRTLEECIIHYHEPNEKRTAEYAIPSWKYGHYDDFWGRAQHFLLPALCSKRRGVKVEGLIGVLERKFNCYSPNRFLSMSLGTGGFVKSPLLDEKIHLLSNRAWQSIINNKEIPEENNLGKWKQISKKVVGESSVLNYSRDFENIAKRQPQRFSKLALTFNKETNPSYIAAILSCFAETEPKAQNITEDEKKNWEPVDFETVEKFLKKTQIGNDDNVAIQFCRMVENRAEEKFSDTIIEKLIDYALNHPDPKEGRLNCYNPEYGNLSENATASSLVDNSLNSVRGVAAIATGAVLWKHKELFEKLKPVIEALANDPHPVVKVATIRTLLPIINIDISYAVHLFVQMCKNDLRISICRYAVELYNWCMRDYKNEFEPLIRELFYSERFDFALFGTKEICARWLFYEYFSDELTEARNGCEAHRMGIAKIASQFVSDEKYSNRCQELLLPLLNDESKKVREQADNLSFAKLLQIGNIEEFLELFIKSKAFKEENSGSRLYYALKDYEGSLIRFAKVINRSVGSLLEGHIAGSIIQSDIPFTLVPVLLRLYEQAKEDDADLMNRCLDSWDLLFEKGIGLTRELTNKIDT